MNPQSWTGISTDPISEEAIRAVHLPHENFKLYLNTHDAETRFTVNAGHAFVLYVLTGSCKTMVDGSEVIMHSSEFINLDKGSYTFDVLDDQQLKLVKVFSLS